MVGLGSVLGVWDLQVAILSRLDLMGPLCLTVLCQGIRKSLLQNPSLWSTLTSNLTQSLQTLLSFPPGTPKNPFLPSHSEKDSTGFTDYVAFQHQYDKVRRVWRASIYLLEHYFALSCKFWGRLRVQFTERRESFSVMGFFEYSKTETVYNCNALGIDAEWRREQVSWLWNDIVYELRGLNLHWGEKVACISASSEGLYEASFLGQVRNESEFSLKLDSNLCSFTPKVLKDMTDTLGQVDIINRDHFPKENIALRLDDPVPTVRWHNGLEDPSPITKKILYLVGTYSRKHQTFLWCQNNTTCPISLRNNFKEVIGRASSEKWSIWPSIQTQLKINCEFPLAVGLVKHFMANLGHHHLFIWYQQETALFLDLEF
eukprot:TRINITY_DN22087_c0_g1_i1.p1 TRINITY_DN22087_c0_g1~~TRINITY_DN22087_c0_g1_i1.p1  ORF type:complete len:399 (+),score=69.79 TRINITY_DN22087_c0_g1_i1:80-1198(+)